MKNNPVAKHAHKYNKCVAHKDKKKHDNKLACRKKVDIG